MGESNTSIEVTLKEDLIRVECDCGKSLHIYGNGFEVNLVGILELKCTCGNFCCISDFRGRVFGNGRK